MLVCRSAMAVSTPVLRFVTDALRAQWRGTRTRWRPLSSGQQALMVVAHLRRARPTAIGRRVQRRDDDGLPVPPRGAEGVGGAGTSV